MFQPSKERISTGSIKGKNIDWIDQRKEYRLDRAIPIFLLPQASNPIKTKTKREEKS
jgi:hypothetical protein